VANDSDRPVSAIRIIELTLYGQDITDDQLSIGVGSTITWELTLLDPNDVESPLDLTDCTIAMSLCALDAGNPIEPPTISAAGVITGDPTDGLCTVSWAATDTVIDGTPLEAGFYALDVWTTDTDDNRLQNMALSRVRLVPAATLPE